MCGISGFYHPKKDYTQQTNRYEDILHSMNQALWHRGPDDSGTFLCQYAGLGHARLEIVDLLTGHQPMLKTVNLGNCL